MEDFAQKIKERTREELDSGLNLPSDESTDSFGNPKTTQRPSSYDSPTPQTTTPDTHTQNNRDMELIIAKLDAIKAEVSHIHNRIENLEKKANEKKKIW